MSVADICCSAAREGEQALEADRLFRHPGDNRDPPCVPLTHHSDLLELAGDVLPEARVG